MALTRTFQQMTKDEKQHSLRLWSMYYQNLKDGNLDISFEYWNKRLDYLQKIGIDYINSQKKQNANFVSIEDKYIIQSINI